MIEVEIKNFQAIDALKLKIEGFTALVGRSNIGKSSIVRALRYALSGGSGTDFIRHDASSCTRIVKGAKSCKCFASVKLMFDEGNGFLWEKGTKSLNRYVVWKDGVESVYEDVGRSADPAEFLDSLRAPIKLGPSQSLLQVSSQFEAPFMLDLSGPAVGDMLSDIGQIDDVNLALSAAVKDRKASASKREVRHDDAKTLGKQLEKYVGLDDHLQKVKQAQATSERVQELQQKCAEAERLLKEVADAIRLSRQITSILAHEVPDLEALEKAARRRRDCATFIAGLEVRLVSVESLNRALRAALPGSEEVVERARKRKQATTFEASWRERSTLVARLEGVEKIQVPDVEPLRNRSKKLVGELDLLGGWLKQLGAFKIAFEKGVRLKTIVVPTIEPLQELAKKLVVSAPLVARQKRLEADVSLTERELAESTRELEEVLTEFAELGSCPTCRQALAPEHSHA